jgi:hypothetical protein
MEPTCNKYSRGVINERQHSPPAARARQPLAMGGSGALCPTVDERRPYRARLLPATLEKELSHPCTRRTKVELPSSMADGPIVPLVMEGPPATPRKPCLATALVPRTPMVEWRRKWCSLCGWMDERWMNGVRKKIRIKGGGGKPVEYIDRNKPCLRVRTLAS